MSITSALVLFAVIWALTFFLVLPWGQVSQLEAGEVEPGTPASAPSDAMIKRKLIITTVIAAVAFAAVYCIVIFQWITLDDINILPLDPVR